MRRYKIFSAVFLCLAAVLLLSKNVFAAAVAQRRAQQAQLQQAQLQQQYQQAILQRQAQEVAVYQQAMAQRQAQQQALQQKAAYQKAAMEYAAYKQAMQVAVARRNAELQAVSQVKQVMAQRQAQQQAVEVAAYQGAMAKKKYIQAKTQAEVNNQVREYTNYLTARKTALSRQAGVVQQVAAARQVAQQAAVQQVAQAKMQAVQLQGARLAAKKAEMNQGVAAIGQKLAADVMSGQRAAAVSRPVSEPTDSDETVVGIEDLWNALDRSGEAWLQIVDKEIKLLTVSEYIDRFRKMHVRITKPPAHYVGLIDSLAGQMTGFLSAPFSSILNYAAVVEYDFDNGADKDKLARNILGEQQFLENRKRVSGH
ncbi:MAG: hypothetical protein WCI27_08110 [Candidatus Omnitrophota bacterium]